MPILARTRRAALARPLAERQDGVAARRQLHRAGLSRWDILAEVRAGRWRAHGRQTIAFHSGPLTPTATLWHLVFESGSRGVLDGVGALIAAGLKGYEPREGIRISVPRGARVIQAPGAVVRQTRRLKAADVVSTGIPRVEPAIAAVRAALWARSDKQAATILAMVTQQRIATAEQIALALLEVRRDKRRRYLQRIVLDLLGGAESLGELDFATLCRRRGLPEPDRQSLRRTPNGRYYLDVVWSRYRVAVEIDGIHHSWATAVVSDAIRQNDLTLEGLRVLRLPVLGLRVDPEAFFTQIERALVAGGWFRSAA